MYATREFSSKRFPETKPIAGVSARVRGGWEAAHPLQLLFIYWHANGTAPSLDINMTREEAAALHRLLGQALNAPEGHAEFVRF